MPPSRRPWAYAETSLVRKAQANAFQRAAQELGRENVAVEDWNRIFGGQTAAALDQKYATQQPATTAEPPKKKNRFGRFVDNLQSADFDDALGDIIHGGAVALAAPKEYLVDPVLGIGSGATSRERKEFLDANGNPTGRYYRDVHENSKHWGPFDVGSLARSARSLADFAKDPVGQYQEGRQAWDESIASPENNAFARTAVQTATDPTLYIGQGTVGGLAKGLSARGLLPTNPAVRAALTGRYSPAGALLEGASAKAALGIALGAGAGAQAAESLDIPWLPEGLERAVLPMAGGALAGGWAGKAKLPSARPWKGAETATRAELGWDVQAMEDDAAVRHSIRAGGVGTSPKARTPYALGRLRQAVEDLAQLGQPGQFWYERSGPAILDAFGGDKDRATKFVQILAILSQGKSVSSQSPLTVRAWFQAAQGLPFKDIGADKYQKAKIMGVLSGQGWEGRKTSNFYRALLREVDPEKFAKEFPNGEPVVDIWMMRAFGFGEKDKPTRAQYDWVSQETKRIADRLGWSFDQVQAAVWTAQKFKTEGRGMEAAAADFSHTLNRHAVQVSWETKPGRTGGALPGIYGAAPQEVNEYHVAVSRALLNDRGADAIAEALGIPTPGSFEAPGVYLGDISPGTQTVVWAPPAPGGARIVDASARPLLDAYAALRGLVLRQEAVPWTRIFPASVAQKDAAQVHLGRQLTPEEAAALDRGLAAAFGSDDSHAIVSTRDGAWVLNTSRHSTNPVPDDVFQKAVRATYGATPGLPTAKIANAMYDSSYIQGGPNGEGYRSILRRAVGAERARELEDHFARRVDAVNAEFADRYGWDDPNRYLRGGDIEYGTAARAFENGTDGPAGLAFESVPSRALAPPGVNSQPWAPRAGNVASGERPPYTGPKPGVENAERLTNGEQVARGKRALISRILMEARRGREGSGLQGVGLDEEAARAAVEFIDALPEQYTELLASSFVSGRDISGRTASAGARVAGTYDPATALITIAKGITNSSADPERVIVHEIAHHLERFVTQEDHAALLRRYQREMGTPGILPGSGQGGEALRRAQGALEKLAADPHAALTAEEAASLEGLYRWQGGFAEWFAENIADRALRDRYPAPVKSAFERAREHVANLLIGAYNFLLRRGERDAAERVYQKLLRGDYEAFDTRLGADGGDELAMAVGPSRYEKQQNVKNARATARTVGADLFASAPAADVRAGQAAYLNSARGRIDNGIRKALAQVPGAVSMDRNLVKDTDVTPFVVQERTRLGNVIDSYEGLADYLMQRVEGAGLKAAFDPEDGNYWVEVGGQRLQFGDLVEGSTQEAQLARAALSREQQAALAEVADFNASLNENLRYHGRSLPFDDSTDNAYFPRVAVGADGVGRPMLPGTGGGLATGGPWAKERTQAAMEAGVADRKLNYANPREAFRLMVRSKLKVAADSRIAEALRPLGQSAEDVNKAGGVAGVTHVELGPTVAPSLNGVYFDGPTAERILAGLKGKPAADVGALRAVNSALTPLRAMGDVSWFGQQGAAFLFRHPLRASRAAVTVIRSAMGDASGYRKLMDGALAEGAERAGIEVAEYRKLLIANGLHFVPDELGETGIGFTSGARRLPVAGKVATFSNETFARYLNLARVMFANDAVELALKTNRMDELQGALVSVNRMTGATGRKPSSAESLVEFAPRFFSAAVEQTFAAVTKGGLEGTIARRHLARMLGTGALITIAANASRGYDTDLDPTSDNFLRIRNVGGLDVSLFGTYSTFFKALARTSTGDTAAPLRLLEGKLSPAVGLIYWPVKGETYLGEPLSPRGDPVGTVYEYGKSMLPFGLQTMVDQGIEPAVRERDAAQLLEGLKSELASGTGLTSTPMSAVERRDFARGDRSESALMVRPEALGIGARQGAAQREYGMDYDQLSGADKSRVNERPDVKGYQAEADRNALTRDDDRSKMTQSSLDIGKKLDALSEEFASGQISGNEFREQYRRLQDELRGARNAVGGGSKGVLGGWFALYDQAQLPDGRVNYERLDALQAAYREQHPEIDDEVARITGVHDNEVMRQYRQAQALAREYYALPAYRGLSLEEGQTAGRVIDIAQAMVQAGMARTIRQAFAQLATQDKEAVRLARIAMNRGANPQRRAFRRANPLFAQFYGDVAQL